MCVGSHSGMLIVLARVAYHVVPRRLVQWLRVRTLHFYELTQTMSFNLRLYLILGSSVVHVGVFVFIWFQIKLVYITLLHTCVLQACCFCFVQGNSKLAFLRGKRNIDFV
jgi:hypothetical protein